MTPTLTLIEEIQNLLAAVRRNNILIAVNLFKLKSAENWPEDKWVSFYKDDLQLSKGLVSKFLKVGEFVVSGGFDIETFPQVSYEKLYLSINRNKDAEPRYVLAEAVTWHADNYKEAKKDECAHTKPAITVCPDCWKKIN